MILGTLIGVSSYVTGRCPQACEDKYRMMVKKGELDPLEINKTETVPETMLNKILHKAFTQEQEIRILEEILIRIDNGCPITKMDIASIEI